MADSEAAYYRALDRALRQAGIAWPVMVIDRDRLDANLDALAAVMPPDKALRIVAKSLPSAELLRHATQRLKTDRLMTFSTAMLRQVHAALPGMQHMFGKPVPAAAVASLLNDEGDIRRLAGETIWLADTAERLRQLQELAGSKDTSLKIALEIDVGLRRGGFDPDGDLKDGLDLLAASPALAFAGLLGYEPHLPSLPSAFGIRTRAERDFRSLYARAQAIAAGVFGEETVRAAIRNSGGSKTLADRAAEDLVNDLSIGSLLVKPLGFDTVVKPAMQPAAFIATPLLKKGAFRVPGFGSTRIMQAVFEGGARDATYIHGGNWLADPVHPPGLRYSKLIGRSSNQEILVSNGRIEADVDDMVFLRPHQSEAILLQFGPLAVVSGGRLEGTWDAFPPTA